jgi:hypothetical protein
MADSEPPESPFNPEKALAELAEATPQRYTKKMSFSENCGLAYALRKVMVRHKDVMEAFGLSHATVSNLANALKPDRPHYQAVWREYERLGEEAFRNAHYTRELHFRLKRIRLQRADPACANLPGGERDRPPRHFGPDLRASKYAGVHLTLEDGSQWAITGADNPWFFYSLDRPDIILRGQEWLEGADEPKRPFGSAGQAFDAVYETNGWLSPRLKPGRRSP